MSFLRALILLTSSKQHLESYLTKFRIIPLVGIRILAVILVPKISRLNTQRYYLHQVFKRTRPSLNRLPNEHRRYLLLLIWNLKAKLSNLQGKLLPRIKMQLKKDLRRFIKTNSHLPPLVRDIQRKTHLLCKIIPWNIPMKTRMFPMGINSIKRTEIAWITHFQRVNIFYINERYLSLLIIRIKNKNSSRNFTKFSNLQWINGFPWIQVHSLNLFKKVIPVMAANNNWRDHREISKMIRKKSQATARTSIIVIASNWIILHQITKKINNTTKANKMQITKPNKGKSPITNILHYQQNLHAMNMMTWIEIQSIMVLILITIIIRITRIDYLIIRMLILSRRLTQWFLRERKNRLEDNLMIWLGKSKGNMNNGRKHSNKNSICKSSNINDKIKEKIRYQYKTIQ